MKRLTLALVALAATVWLAQALSAQPPKRAAGPPNPLIRVFDTDGDGRLSTAEIDGAAAKLRALDTNQDGTLTTAELPRGGGPGGGFGPGNEPDLQKPLIPKDDA